jgi:hypothetical protein
MRLSLRNGLFEIGMLVSGAVITVSKKAMNGESARGWGGVTHRFAHPWVQTSLMFAGEAVCLVAFLILLAVSRYRTRRR